MTDPRLDPLLQSAVTRLVAGMTQAIDKTGTQLGMLALAANSNAERQALMNAEYDLQRHCTQVGQAFARDLGERVAKDLQRQQPDSAAFADTDWTALRLVENAEVEETVTAARLTRLLEIDAEAPLRELRAFFATLQGCEAHDDVFPLRPAIVGKALLKAVTQASEDAAAQQHLARVLATHASVALKDCYDHLGAECRRLGVQAAPLAVRKPSAPSSTLSPGLPSGDSSGRMPLQSAHGDLQGSGPGDADQAGAPARALGALFGMPCPAPLDPEQRQGTGGHGGGPRGQGTAPGGASAGASPGGDSGMLGLMRRLQSLATMSPGWAASSHSATGELSSSGTPLPNLIRAHREELVQASGGAALDQMVIDIVATLFDQVLSDPKVPPQMARQIGRLQLPVLRVALRDQSFFHSRRHPVRRLINRMATLAGAFDALDDGPGRECIEMVTGLVREIVEGDFDRIDLYESKLADLEAFVARQTARDVEDNADVAALLSGKEADLRV